MTNQQLYLLIGVPMLFNAGLIGLLLAVMSAKFDSVNSRFESINSRFEAMDARLDGIDQRLNDMRDLWRAELHRVEGILDARLKHLEERLFQ